MFRKIIAAVSAALLLMGGSIPAYALGGDFALTKAWAGDGSCTDKAEILPGNTVSVKAGGVIYFDVNNFLSALRKENEGTPYYLEEIPYVYDEAEEEEEGGPYSDYLPLSNGSYLADRSFCRIFAERTGNAQAISKTSALRNSTAADGVHRNLIAVSVADSAKGTASLRLGFSAARTLYTDSENEEILCDQGDVFYTKVILRINP